MEESEIPEKLNMVVRVPCESCGWEMTFSPEKQVLTCTHCGNTRALGSQSDLIVENSFSDQLNADDLPSGFGTKTKVFHCNNCGSETAIAVDTVTFSCPFCSSTNVNEEAQQTKIIQPAGILPFKIDRKKALEKYSEWLKKGLFAPSSLKKIAALEKISGVYVPFWTYDAMTRSQWTADAGYHYYVSESYYENGQHKTRSVQKTRWVPASGYYENFFNDVLIIGSHGVSQNSVEKIYPYSLEESVNYDSRFILGFQSEVYQVDVTEGYHRANNIMDAFIYAECGRQVPGDTHRNLHVNTHKSDITFKHLLLPLWVAAYKFRKKTFQFLVNGQTGKIAGKKPVSVGKVLLAILLGAAIIGTAWYFLSKK